MAGSRNARTTVLATLAVLAVLTATVFADAAHAGEKARPGGLVVVKGVDGSEAEFSSINEALARASPNDTVLVYPGVYKEHVVVQKPVRIIGVGSPVIDGGGRGTIITITNTSNVVIENVRLVNSGRLYSTEDSGIKIEWSRDIVVSRVVIENAFYPIYVMGSERVLIKESNISSIREYHVAYRGHGVYVWYSNHVDVIGNFFYTLADGVYCDHAYNLTVRNNRVQDGRYGVHLMYCEDVLITNNMVTRTISGIVPMYSENVVVSNNTVLLVRTGGIGEGLFIQESDNIVVVDNVIAGNIIGIHVGRTPYRPGSTALVKRNLVAFNLIGVVIDTVSEVVFTENSFIENVRDVSLVGFGTSGALWYDPESARGNFWSNNPLANTYVLTSNQAEELVGGHRELAIFTFSPSYMLLETLASKSAGEARVKAVDPHPLRKPVVPITLLPRVRETEISTSVAMATAPLAASLLAYVVIRRAGG